MRVHTSLTELELHAALQTSGLAAEGVYLATMVHGSRKRAHAVECKLSANPGVDREGTKRRWQNSGNMGSVSRGNGFYFADKAATYDEWGWWLAEVFERDPNAIAGPYNGADGFNEMTRYKYDSAAERSHWVMAEDERLPDASGAVK